MAQTASKLFSQNNPSQNPQFVAVLIHYVDSNPNISSSSKNMNNMATVSRLMIIIPCLMRKPHNELQENVFLKEEDVKQR